MSPNPSHLSNKSLAQILHTNPHCIENMKSFVAWKSSDPLKTFLYFSYNLWKVFHYFLGDKSFCLFQFLAPQHLLDGEFLRCDDLCEFSSIFVQCSDFFFRLNFHFHFQCSPELIILLRHNLAKVFFLLRIVRVWGFKVNCWQHQVRLKICKTNIEKHRTIFKKLSFLVFCWIHWIEQNQMGYLGRAPTNCVSG